MKIVNNLTLATIKRYPMFTYDNNLDFEDDGNYFKGFMYKEELPITTLRSYGETYLSIRVDYITDKYGFTYNEWRKQPEAYLCDKYNRCDNIDMDDLVDICEKILMAMHRLRDKVQNENIDTEPIKARLDIERRELYDFLERCKEVDWTEIPTDNLKIARTYLDGIKNHIGNINKLYLNLDTYDRPTQRGFAERLTDYGYVVVNLDTCLYISKIKEIFGWNR